MLVYQRVHGLRWMGFTQIHSQCWSIPLHGIFLESSVLMPGSWPRRVSLDVWCFCPDLLAEVHWSGLNYKSESPSFECIKYNRVASLGLHDVIIMIFKHSRRNFRWETSPFPFQNFRSGFDSPRGHRPTQGGQTTLTCLHQWTSAQTETHRPLGPSGPENGDLKMVTHFQRQQMVGWFGWLSCFLSWLFFPFYNFYITKVFKTWKI